MTLLQSCLIDVLKPEKGIFPYYELFLSRYSLITVTTIISQCTLIPDTYKDMTKADMDKDIDWMIEGLPEGSEYKRNIYKFLCMSAHINPGESIQENETRTFTSELFTEDAKKYSLSNREMILRGLNSSAFLNYFFLIEDSLKNIYIDLAKPCSNFIKGGETIEVCLEKIISTSKISYQFEKELYSRSKFFFDMKSLKLMWSLLNLIRNKIAHTNGFYDNNAKRTFNRRIESLARHYSYSGNDDCLMSVNMILDVFENHKKQIKKTNYLVVDDSLENIIRNISIFIMESLYTCNRDKIAKKAIKRN